MNQKHSLKQRLFTLGAKACLSISKNWYRLNCGFGKQRLSPDALAGLRQEFQEAWASCGDRLGVSDESWFAHLEQLLARYSEGWRHYHHLGHIRDCLSLLKGTDLSEGDRDLVYLSIWYHDAIYDPWCQDNEARSAELARKHLTAAGVAPVVVERVAALILMTRHHEGQDGDPLANLFLDIDMAILSADRELFQHYEHAIRQEYQFVPGFLFRRFRRQFLQKTLASQIYHSPAFAPRETIAKANIQNSLALMAEAKKG